MTAFQTIHRADEEEVDIGGGEAYGEKPRGFERIAEKHTADNDGASKCAERIDMYFALYDCLIRSTAAHKYILESREGKKCERGKGKIGRLAHGEREREVSSDEGGVYEQLPRILRLQPAPKTHRKTRGEYEYREDNTMRKKKGADDRIEEGGNNSRE